jgi:hypothetical protein
MTDQPEARRSARVDKPWGHEEIFAEVEGSYVGKTLHVTGGLTDCVLVEASTAAPGWQEDVVRLDDRYGRRGKQAP